MNPRKKLIEVALPLEAINRESAREKSLRHGHPSTLHLWWARRPLAACRAVLFASLVDDPSAHPKEFRTEEAQEAERQRLFRIIEELVKWENSSNERVLEVARGEILKSTDGDPPPVLDPFCGGGSIPSEAQRLGLTAYASDLNPVAVLITKALIEIPPKFASMPPVNPESRAKLDYQRGWKNAEGLAEDIRYYGRWMRDEAQKRIGHLYPKAKLPDGSEATVIAWIWARTVRCPNPACGAEMQLVRSFELSRKKGKKAWVEPIINREEGTVTFAIGSGNGDAPPPPKLGRGAKFRCLVCEQTADERHIKAEGLAGRMGAQLMALVAEGDRERVFLPPTADGGIPGFNPENYWAPDVPLADDPRNVWCVNYGLRTFADLFTDRQLAALDAFSGLVAEARREVERDLESVEAAPWQGSENTGAYAAAIATYLALSVSKATDLASSLCHWQPNAEHLKIAPTFSRHALPMSWDFAEGNPFSDSSGNFSRQWELISEVVGRLGIGPQAHTAQLDATVALLDVPSPLIVTDPPYFDNISYADLSDYFYVWLRRMLAPVFPDLFSTVLTPKSAELVAAPQRFNGSTQKAEAFFEDGLERTFLRVLSSQHAGLPVSFFYAFKQAEGSTDGFGPDSVHFSTGWETMLSGLLAAGFSVSGTWPMRTERQVRSISIGANALASSIVLVCRPRSNEARLATRKELIAAMRDELPEALKRLQHGNIAPVDLAQAAIGPGMAVFSRYSRIVESDGSQMRVRDALAIINQVLDETLSEQEMEFDAPTRWAGAWFETHGLKDGPYGQAEVLSKAKDVSVHTLAQDGFLKARAGKVRLLSWEELDPTWNPTTDKHLTIWEVTHHLIRAHQDSEIGSEALAADLLKRVGHGVGETARDLAYRLYSISERKGWAKEALAYNALVVAWPEIARLAAAGDRGAQTSLGV